MRMVRIQISGAQGRTEEKSLSQPAVLGRDPQCDVVINDHQISRQHCRIEPQQDGVLVIDLNSRNGVYVNGQRLMKHLLKPGEVLEIGGATLRLQVVALTEADAQEIAESVSNESVSPAKTDSTTAFADNTKTEQIINSLAHRQAMWERAAASRQAPVQNGRRSVKHILGADKRARDEGPQKSARRWLKPVAITFLVAALAVLAYETADLLRPNSSITPARNAKPNPAGTPHNRAISD